MYDMNAKILWTLNTIKMKNSCTTGLKRHLKHKQ